jgi:hypothetical protein
MDGHHRWIASYMVDPSSVVKGKIVNFPRKQLIAVLNTVTAGALGIKKGNAATGGFDQFSPDSIIKSVREFAKSGNEFIKPEAVLQAAQTFTGVEGEKAIDAMAKKFAQNISSATLQVPSGSPAREDMPVIDPENIGKAVSILQAGNVDLNEPYGNIKGSKEDDLKKESRIFERWNRLAGLK